MQPLVKKWLSQCFDERRRHFSSVCLDIGLRCQLGRQTDGKVEPRVRRGLPRVHDPAPLRRFLATRRKGSQVAPRCCASNSTCAAIEVPSGRGQSSLRCTATQPRSGRRQAPPCEPSSSAAPSVSTAPASSSGMAPTTHGTATHAALITVRAALPDKVTPRTYEAKSPAPPARRKSRPSSSGASAKAHPGRLPHRADVVRGHSSST